MIKPATGQLEPLNHATDLTFGHRRSRRGRRWRRGVRPAGSRSASARGFTPGYLDLDLATGPDPLVPVVRQAPAAGAQHAIEVGRLRRQVEIGAQRPRGPVDRANRIEAAAAQEADVSRRHGAHQDARCRSGYPGLEIGAAVGAPGLHLEAADPGGHADQGERQGAVPALDDNGHARVIADGGDRLVQAGLVLELPVVLVLRKRRGRPCTKARAQRCKQQ